jgi:hypothetical protein
MGADGFQIDAQGPFIVSAPGDDHDYGIDWTNLLTGVGESIATVVWTIPAGVSVGVEAVVGNISLAWLTTPTLGTYFILATMTSNQSRVWNRGFRVLVSENI